MPTAMNTTPSCPARARAPYCAPAFALLLLWQGAATAAAAAPTIVADNEDLVITAGRVGLA